MLWIILILSGSVFGGGSAIIAANKNRNSLGWFILGFCFSFVGLIVIAALSAVPQTNHVNRNRKLRLSTNSKQSEQAANLDWKQGSEFVNNPQDPERPWLS